jgi:ribosomal RNA assembly protein
MFDFIKIPDKMKRVLIKDNKGKKNIEDLTNTKITIEDSIKIEGEGFAVYQAKQVLKAFGRGFIIKDALALLDDDYGLEIINLRDIIRSDKRIIVVKARVIGTKGKTKKMIEKYTETQLSIQGRTVSILGKWDKLNVSKEAIMMMVDGCGHTALYKWLERQYSGV